MTTDSPRPIPPEAIAVLQTFLDASLRKDKDTMRACLSKKTLEGGGFSGEGPDNMTFVLGEPTWEGDSILVPVTGTPNDPEAGRGMELPAILIQEDNQWKFDLASSMDRMFGGSMENTMNQLVDTMSQAVGAIGSAFADGMSQAMGGGEDNTPQTPIPDWNLVPLIPCVDEILPMPEMTPLPKLSAALTQIVGTEVIAQAAMKDLLRQVASDQHEVLMNWFEDQLFARWPDVFIQVTQANPLAGRLRAVRFEAAGFHEHRFIALDGNDLVYRLYINDQAGYYSDDEIASILPGVLAGLPQEMIPALANYRFLPSDDEYPPWSTYKECIVPRFMRRISDLLGKPIRLEADFDDVYDGQTAARQLTRWGINRIYGALALACLDYEIRYRLADAIHTIRLKMSFDDRVRFASLENGVLEVGTRDYSGEAGGFYEYQLLEVLNGKPILGENVVADDASQQSEDSGDESTDEAQDGEESSPGSDAEEAAGDAHSFSDDQYAAANAEAQRNDENFAAAVASLRENGEPAWRQQLEMAFGRPINLSVDYDSLGGRHDLVMPFIHRSLSAGLGAVSMLGFDPHYRPSLAPIEHVIITQPGEHGQLSISLDGNTLVISVPLGPEGPPPVQGTAAAIKSLLTGETPPATGDNSPPDGEDAPPAHTSSQGDAYAQAGDYMDRLEAVLRQENMWPGDPPPGPIEVKGAFGCENMAFEQWLAWILIPRVREIITTKDSFPNGSNVAAYAVRELDGHPGGGPVIDVLANFDQFINDLATK